MLHSGPIKFADSRGEPNISLLLSLDYINYLQEKKKQSISGLVGYSLLVWTPCGNLYTD